MSLIILYIKKKHEFRSVKIFEKIREHNKDLQKEVNEKEAQVIGKMITFSEDCKVIHDNIIKLKKKTFCKFYIFQA